MENKMRNTLLRRNQFVSTFTNWNGDQEIDIITASRQNRIQNFLRNIEIVVVEHGDEENIPEGLRELLQRSLYDQELKRNDSIELDVCKQPCTKEDEKDDCRICMNNFEENEDKTLLPCTHKFHYDCLIEWGKHKQECPICRASIAKK